MQSDGVLVHRANKDYAVLAARYVINRIKKHYIMSSIYFVGLLAAVIGSGLSVTNEQRSVYEQQVSRAQTITGTDLTRLARELYINEQLYYKHKGWFSCDSTCMVYHDKCEGLRRQLKSVKDQRDGILLEGRQTVGAWSVYGISDLRRAFWQAWEDGKEAARRMTMLDAVFIGLGSMTGSNSDRDNSFIITLIRIILQFVANLTFGLMTAFVVFAFEAWSIISSYGPSVLSHIALFGLTLAASGSVVTSAIGGIAGCTVAGIYWVYRTAEMRSLQEHRNRRLHYD